MVLFLDCRQRAAVDLGELAEQGERMGVAEEGGRYVEKIPMTMMMIPVMVGPLRPMLLAGVVRGRVPYT